MQASQGHQSLVEENERLVEFIARLVEVRLLNPLCFLFLIGG